VLATTVKKNSLAMCVERNYMASSRNEHCQGKATMSSFCIEAGASRPTI
jgi:hypothetical protein